MSSQKRCQTYEDPMNCEDTPPEDLRDLRLSLGLGRLRKISCNSRHQSFRMNSSIRSEVGATGDESPMTQGSEFDSASSPMHCSTPKDCAIIPSIDNYNPEMGNTTPFMAMTPELSMSPSVNPMDPNKLFPLFRPLAEKKTLHIIRHGESEYNAADKVSTSWQEIMIFDPKLTDRGRMQAKNLRRSLDTMKLGKALWAVSPLTRALETFQIACPKTPVLQAEAAGEPTYGELPRVEVLPDMSEHLMTAGDIGRPASELMKDFPFLKEQLDDVGEKWWYSSDKKDNCPHEEVFHAVEPKASLRRRVESFRRWLAAQGEHTVVAVGHSMFWKEFLPDSKILKNCEVYTTSV